MSSSSLLPTANNTNGVILWEGTSQLDGVTPIVAIMTGITRKSKNDKTLDLKQIWIIRSDKAPNLAATDNTDGGICGDGERRCIHARRFDEATGKFVRTCYVNLRTPSTIFRCYSKGNYGKLNLYNVEQVRQAVWGRGVGGVRIGAYGDPAAVPYEVWKAITEVADFTTGYTHQWQWISRGYGEFCMASSESTELTMLAESMGYRAFQVVGVGEAKQTMKEMVSAGLKPRRCPSDPALPVKVGCADCKGCSGFRVARHVVIEAHGATAKQYRTKLSVL